MKVSIEFKLLINTPARQVRKKATSLKTYTHPVISSAPRRSLSSLSCQFCQRATRPSTPPRLTSAVRSRAVPGTFAALPHSQSAQLATMRCESEELRLRPLCRLNGLFSAPLQTRASRSRGWAARLLCLGHSMRAETQVRACIFKAS